PTTSRRKTSRATTSRATTSRRRRSRRATARSRTASAAACTTEARGTDEKAAPSAREGAAFRCSYPPRGLVPAHGSPRAAGGPHTRTPPPLGGNGGDAHWYVAL